MARSHDFCPKPGTAEQSFKKPFSRALLAALLLVGCAQKPSTAPTLIGEPVDQVLIRIKQEVGFYYQTVNTEPKPAPLPADYDGCGNGSLNFDLSKVNIKLTTVITSGGDEGFGIKVPFAHLAGNASGGFTTSLTYTGTQNLSLTTYPIPDPEYRAPKLMEKDAPIASAILALRNSLRETAMMRPCFTLDKSDLLPPKKGETSRPAEAVGKDDENTYSIAFEVLAKQGSTLGFDFLILSANADQNDSQKAGNTVTISFKPHSLMPPNPNIVHGRLKGPGSMHEHLYMTNQLL